MKEIKFHKLSLAHKPFLAVLMISAGLFPVISLFDVFDFLGEQNVKMITAACYLIIAYFFGLRQFVYHNHVQWNKRGINIRVNNFWGITFSFSEVKKVTYAEDNYSVQLYGGATKVIDLSRIEQVSKERLLQILRTNTQ